MHRNIRRAALLLLSTAALPTHASGQEAAPATEDDFRIGDIVVTAQKREESLQDTPISIVALDAAALEEKGINALSDLFTGAIPSVRISPFLGRASAVSIGMRGLVPVDATQVTRDPTVGVYVDGVYLGRVSGLGMELSDVERIEVLRGPQGTLFGRNTIGGAISVVTKRPTGEFGLDLRAGFGNFRGRNFAGHLNLPEAANISVKVDGMFEGRGGIVANPLATSRDFGEIRKYGFKISALFAPSDNLSILYSWDMARDQSTGAYAYIRATDQAAAVRPSFITLDTRRVDVGRIGVPVLGNPQRADGHSVTAEWDVANALTVRSISAWRSLDSTQWDQDSGGVTAWGPNRRFGRLSFARVVQSQFSQELQLVGTAGDFRYVVGGYYFREKGRDEATVFSAGVLNSTNTGINLFPVPTPDAGPTRVPDRSASVRITSKALFGQLTWSPSAAEGLHVTAGARYTDDRKVGRLTAIAAVDPRLSFVFASKRVDPMVTVAYDFSEDINAYIKWSRAYRAGGANTRSSILRAFGEEELTAWEGGIKADLFDRRMRVNLAAYASTLSDQQVDFINPAFISNTETVNAPEKRKIKGIEADVTVIPFRGLTLSANYVFTDAPPTPVRNIFSGNIEQARSAFTPKHAATFTADYRFPPLSFGTLSANVNLDTAGNYFANGTVNFKSEADLLLNARVTLADINVGGTNLSLSVWGKNLTNAQYDLFNFRVAGRNTLMNFNDPRTYGVEARLRF